MKLYSIGQASAMIDIPIRTIRYYESIGLCSPSLTDEDSGYRYYSLDDIFRLDLIRCLGRQLGMPLKTIRQYLKESGSPETLKTYLRQQASGISREMAELERRRDFLMQKLEAIELREQTPGLSPYFEMLETRELSVVSASVDSLEDAMLIARKIVSQIDGCRASELFLIFDTLADKFSHPGPHSVMTGVPGRIERASFSRLVLGAGEYASIHYTNRDEDRREAIALLRDGIAGKGLRTEGPMVNSGSLIDTTSASSRDYCIKTQIRVVPA